MCQYRTLALVRVSPVPGPRYGWSGPYTEGSGPHPREPIRYLGVPDHIRGFRLCVQGSGASSWRPGPTDCILGYIIFSGHVAPLEPSTWWGRVLFTARLEIAAGAPCLHTVVRGTPDLGYRQWPPSPPQGRIRAYRRGQSLAGDWLAASVRPLVQLLPVRHWSR
jgi:hypothetical protein